MKFAFARAASYLFWCGLALTRAINKAILRFYLGLRGCRFKINNVWALYLESRRINSQKIGFGAAV